MMIFCRYHSIVTIIVFSFLAVQTESQECRKNGFFRHPEDCTRFYRCVDLTGRGYFQKYTFSCPVGTVFDENVSVCNHPWAAPPCEESEDVEEDKTTEGSVVGVVEEGDEEEESVRLSFKNPSPFLSLTSSTHYSKSQIFVQKFNFDKTPTFSKSFSPKFFFDNFSREIKVVNS